MDDAELDLPKRESVREEALQDGKDETECDDASPEVNKEDPIKTSTKNALITHQLGPCDVYPHPVKISIVGVMKVGVACAMAILMRRIASEVCLIDQNEKRVSAEAEDIQHAGVFIGCPLVTGTTVSIWSSVHVAGTKIRDINPRMGEADDPEKWRDISDAVNKTEAELNRRKGERGPSCWALGFCTAEIVDAIVRNTKTVLPVSTYIQNHSCGIDKDIYISVPCVIGREGVHATVRQKLDNQEKVALQRCANDTRNALRECGILHETNEG